MPHVDNFVQMKRKFQIIYYKIDLNNKIKGGLVLNFYGMTDKGLQREMNQDVFYTHKFSEQVGFAIVCDGMGGQSAGNIASEMACSIVSKKLIENEIDKADTLAIRDIMVNAISEANIQVYTKSNIEPGFKGMGTTVVVCVVVCNTAHFINIGDSRAYVLQNNKLRQITKDHSLVQELLEQGKIKEHEVSTHPNKNMITRAVGVNLVVDIDYLSLQLEYGDKLILCTDGLTNMVDDKIIEAELATNNAQSSCKKLIDIANKAGGIDNITVAVIE